MPTTETIELSRSLAEMGMPIRFLIVNGILPPLFSAKERLALERVGAFDVRTPGDSAIAAGRDRATRERMQAESLERLRRELAGPAVFLPLLMEDAAQPEAIRELARRVP
jgi:hypothetical protein